MHTNSLSLKIDLKVGDPYVSSVLKSRPETPPATKHEPNKELKIEFNSIVFHPTHCTSRVSLESRSY